MEDDYDQMAHDPLVPVAQEVDQPSRGLKGEAGRSGEVNKTSVKTILTLETPLEVPQEFRARVQLIIC